MALPNKAKEVQADLYDPTIPLLGTLSGVMYKNVHGCIAYSSPPKRQII